MPKKVLFIVSNAHAIGPHNRRTGNFLPEVAHPHAEFDRAGYQIDFASLTGDTPFLDALNLAGDPDNLSFLIFQLGGSVAHASLKDYYSITETDSNPTIQATLDKMIASATPWFQPGMTKHRRWCPSCRSVRDVKPSGACHACNHPL